MGAYQSQASLPSIPPSRGLPLPDAVLQLPAADYYISLNAHQGRPEVLTAWFDPSVTDEFDPASVDQSMATGAATSPSSDSLAEGLLDVLATDILDAVN